MAGGNGKSPPRVVRCAIYTRKSTSEGLDMDFNTLDAQREASEHHIKAHVADGWIALPTHYDDGGFTGGNLSRPALQRLLQDIERGDVDMVVVYKVDRLSRSLLDFTRLIETFEQKNIGFVSITQNFDTSSSMGRLMMNVLLSFAQFERELISERTRDKIAAARRRGKWTGGPLVLGYRVDQDKRALAVIPAEAEVVRLAFDLYLKTRSIGLVASRLNLLGYTQKLHTTKKGRSIGGKPWNKDAVHHLLRNPLYVGKVRQKDDLYPGEHTPIVRVDVFEKVQQTLAARSNGRGTRRKRNPDFLLTGILRCQACDSAMVSSVTRGGNGSHYRYYRCCREVKEGIRCPTGLVAADRIEKQVVSHVRAETKQGDIQRAICEHLAGDTEFATELTAQRGRLNARLEELNSEARRLLGAFSNADAGGKLLVDRLGELEAQMDRIRLELGNVEKSLQTTVTAHDDATRVAEFLAEFDGLWDQLVNEERHELLATIIRSVYVDAATSELHFEYFDHEPPTPDSPASLDSIDAPAASAGARP